MRTAPNGWHPDGSWGPYSHDEGSFLSAVKGIFWDLPIAILKLIFSIDDDENINTTFDESVSISLFVFGLPGAGKTTFLEKIGANVTTAGIGTAEEKYPAFDIKFGEKNIRIKEGIDIGGDKRYLEDGKIEEMLKEKDKVIFIFDAHMFLNNEKKQYRGIIMARLKALYEAQAYRSKVYIIGSRLDECQGNRNVVANEIKKQLADKTYRQLLNDSFGVYNLTNNEDIELIKTMIFK